MPKQLAFAFSPNDEPTFENFYPGKNQLLLKLLKNFSEQSDIFCVYLWGGNGMGKTHLLRAVCHEKNQHANQSAAYLPLTYLKNSSPALLEDFSHLSLVCVDDVNAISENAAWEEALFHFYNEMQSSQRHLMVSGTMNPQHLSIRLPDLKSRLVASFIVELNGLSDEEKLVVLKQRAHARGFDLSQEVMSFLITHYPRDMKQLMHMLNQLDKASLTEKQRITIPLTKKVIQFT